MHMKSRFQLFVAIIAVALLAFQPFAAKAAAPSLPALEVTAGTYHSDEISGGEAEGETLELTLYDDGTALLFTSMWMATKHWLNMAIGKKRQSVSPDNHWR